MPSVGSNKAQNGDGCDSEVSFTWEDFFGSTTTEDLVPTLLGMYDALVGRTSSIQQPPPPPYIRPACKPPPPPSAVPRPLSITSIGSSSSSSSSSVTSSCSGGVGRRLGGTGAKSAAYLASIESLEDSEEEKRPPATHRLKVHCNASQGSGDSGVHSPCSFISSPSPPHGRPRYCDPHLSYMDRVVMEIVETEAVYVADLRQVIVGYKERWQGSSECPLTQRHMEDLFSNIEDIYLFNSSFLCELEKCGLDPVKVARCFVRNNDGFSIYTEYCTNYPRTVSVLTELMRQEATVKLFRERQLSLHHTLPLGSYLLKPVQRILKYHLLLQNIVKQSSESKPGYSDIVNALSTMTAIAHHINDMKKKHEHAVRVQEIQSLLLGWEGEDLTTYGELCAEGTFRMSGAKALRHAFLFDKMLLITKKKEEGILGYKTHIMCSNLMLIESVPGEPLSFHVIPFDNPRQQYTLQSRNLEQKREWTLQLKRVILENYNAVIPSHARQLVMQLGQNRTDDEILAERATPKKQHSAPEYLEKRKQERERRKSETGLRARLRSRSRNSDAGICNKAQQRLRRSHQNREKNENPTPENNIERVGSPVRRKSEPSCLVNSVSRNTSKTPLMMSVTELHISESDLTSAVEKEEVEGPAEKKRTLEEIVGQLLMQNREFQRILKRHRHLSCRRRVTETSDEEDEYPSRKHNRSRSCHSERGRESLGDYDNLQDNWETNQLIEIHKYNLKRTQSFTSQEYESSPEQSLPCSLSRLSLDNGPNSPAVWLKQQYQHLASAPTKKSGSLPRSFQLTQASDWPQRPVTIASDKPQELNLDDMERYMDKEKESCLNWRHRFPVPDDTTEEDSTTEYTASIQQLNIHPEYKIYKRGLTKATLKMVISSVTNKLASLRASSEMLNDSDTEKRSRSVSRSKQRDEEDSDMPTYKQGSSSLGARIAHGSETSDYADPRVLFPSITPSKKAASLLGIRPYSVLSLVSNLTSSSDGDKTSGYSGSNSSTIQDPIKKGDESDGSIDSFYERSFEAMESVMDNEIFRDSAVFSDPEDMFEQVVNINTKNKVPPPVPAKPTNLKAVWRIKTQSPQDVDECDSSSVASTVIESTSSKGWVKHVIGKLQGDTAQS